MPRRGAALVAALGLGLGLGACAADADGSTSAPRATSGSEELDPATITVFAAASLTDAFEELARRFEQANPSIEVTLSTGGSGALAQQVVEGAPADVFAAAAEPPMEVVADAGLVVEPQAFATNTLELVVPAGDPAAVDGLDDLARDDLRIALCDPSVPCGAASVDLLELAGVEASPDTLESDVRAVLTKVTLGEVDAGLVYRTDAIAAGDGVERIEVPEAASVVNRYPIAALADAAHPEAAAAFAAFVTGPTGREVLDAFGFGAP